MNRLWAPWRKAYLSRKKPKGCALCQIGNASNDAAHHVLKRTPASFAVLNLFPYNAGHVLIIPNRHVKDLEDLNDVEFSDLFRLLRQTIQQIKRKMKPGGVNVGINLGRAAGAGITGHLHIHAVPRWIADSNFSTSIADTRVISESLQSVYRRLKWDQG